MNGHDGMSAGASPTSSYVNFTTRNHKNNHRGVSNDFNYRTFKLTQASASSSRKASQNDLLLVNTHSNSQEGVKKRKSLNYPKATTTTTTTPSKTNNFETSLSTNSNNSSNNVSKFKHYFQKHLSQEYSRGHHREASSQQQLMMLKTPSPPPPQQQQQLQQTLRHNISHRANNYETKSKSNSMIKIKKLITSGEID